MITANNELFSRENEPLVGELAGRGVCRGGGGEDEH